MSAGQTIDDVNSDVVYSAGWYARSGVIQCYGGTMHETTVAQAKAVLTFTGTGIIVNATPSSYSSAASYSVDGIYNSYNQTPSSQELYRSPTLPNGQHTLTVINLTDGYLLIDFFMVIQTTENADPTSTTSTVMFTTTSSTSSSSSSTSGTSTTANSSSTIHSTTLTKASSSGASVQFGAASTTVLNSTVASPTAPSTDSRHALIITSAVIAGLATFLIFCGIVFFCLRRRRKRKASLTSAIDYDTLTSQSHATGSHTQTDGQTISPVDMSMEPPPYDLEPTLRPHSNRVPAKFRNMVQ